jgi:uroporphyrinogen-III synthase
MSAQHAPAILLTRPLAQSRRFAALLGRECLIAPLLAPVFLAADLPGHAAVILTSETGAQAAARLVAPGLAFCVGDRTAEVARALGFQARSAAGDAEALIQSILAAPDPGPLLHLRGREARGEIAARLTALGRPTQEAIVYAQEPQPLTPAAIAALQGQGPVILPLFSPRSATLFAAEARRIGAKAPLRVVAMSPAVREAAARLGASCLVAARPDAKSMAEATLAAIESRPAA